MGRKKGAKSIDEGHFKAIHDMSCLGVRNRDIALHYKVHLSTILKNYKA